jgi:hypothetical protein
MAWVRLLTMSGKTEIVEQSVTSKPERASRASEAKQRVTVTADFPPIAMETGDVSSLFENGELRSAKEVANRNEVNQADEGDKKTLAEYAHALGEEGLLSDIETKVEEDPMLTEEQVVSHHLERLKKKAEQEGVVPELTNEDRDNSDAE